MKLYNKKTAIAYVTRTQKTAAGFLSIVERWETDSQGVPFRAYLSSKERHATRGKARVYAESMARYQFRAHVAVYGMVTQ
jgi:hypothetical protein